MLPMAMLVASCHRHASKRSRASQAKPSRHARIGARERDERVRVLPARDSLVIGVVVPPGMVLLPVPCRGSIGSDSSFLDARELSPFRRASCAWGCFASATAHVIILAPLGGAGRGALNKSTHCPFIFSSKYFV